MNHSEDLEGRYLELQCRSAGVNTAPWVVSFRSYFYVVAGSFQIGRRRNGLAPGKVKDIVYDLRKMTNNSKLSRNLEQAVTRYVAWVERQAPGVWEAMKAFRTPQK